MPVHSHHTQSAPAPQGTDLVGDAWATEIVPRLPANLDAQAHTLKAFQRIRGVACPTDLLRAILAYVLEAAFVSAAGCLGRPARAGRYLRHRLAQAAALRQPLAGLADRRTAGRHRRDRARPDSPVSGASCWSMPPAWRQLGGSGDDWRVHLVYDLLAARMGQVVVTDQKGAEQLAHFDPQPGDILVGDCGYGYRKNVAFAHGKQADSGAAGLSAQPSR